MTPYIFSTLAHSTFLALFPPNPPKNTINIRVRILPEPLLIKPITDLLEITRRKLIIDQPLNRRQITSRTAQILPLCLQTAADEIIAQSNRTLHTPQTHLRQLRLATSIRQDLQPQSQTPAIPIHLRRQPRKRIATTILLVRQRTIHV